MASGERVVRIRFDGSASGLTSAAAKARAELKTMQKQVETNRKSLDSFTSRVGALTAGVGQAALTLSNLSGGVGIIVALASGLTAASGAAFLLPAALGAVAAILLTTKLGADGIKAAFDQLTPTLDTLKGKVSATFQTGLAPAVNDLKGILPQLTGGFQGIAAALSSVLVRVTSLVKAPQQIGALNAILSGTATIIRNVGAFLAPVIAGFITLAAAAMPSLTQLTAGLGSVGDRFKAWTDQVAAGGFVAAWIQGAVDLFRQLWAVLGDVGSIVADVFRAMQDSGAGLGGILGGLLGTVRAFLDSAQGHDTLVAVFQALNTVGQAVSTVLGAALRAVAPLLPPLLSAFAQLATQVSGFLVPAIQILAPLLAGLAGFLAQNMSWLGPILITLAGLAGVIYTIIAAVNVWKTVVQAYTTVQWLLNAALDANPIGIVITAIAALVAAIVILWNNSAAFRDFFIGVWHGIQDVVGAIAGWFSSVWSGALGWVQGAVSAAGNFFSSIWRGVQGAVSGVVNWFSSAWSNSINAVRGFFGGLADFAGGVFDGVIGGIKGAINGVLRVVNGAIGGVNRVTGIVGIPAIPQIPYLAKGGTAQSGRPYLVGEQGPELFVPGRTGRVVNANTTADAMGGAGQTIALTIDLGEGIQQAFEIKIDRNNSATARALRQRTGASR